MAEYSYVWGETTIGDAVYAPYTASQYNGITRTYFVQDNTQQGVIQSCIPDFEDRLDGTITDSATFTISKGAAIVDGNIYTNSDDVAFDIDACSAGNVRWDRVVLRKSFAGKTVRLAVLTGAETGSPPPTPTALTQTTNVTWEIPLWTFEVDDTGITDIIYDDRCWVVMPLVEDNHYLAGGRLTLDKTTAFSSADVTIADGTMYYISFTSEYISLFDTVSDRYVSCRIQGYDAGVLQQYIKIEGLTDTGQYDIFLYKSGNAIKYEAVLIAGANGRTYELPKNEGVPCMIGNVAKRYVGSVYSSGGTIYDSTVARNVWNMYNRRKKDLYQSYSPDHVYNPVALTWREWNDDSSDFALYWVAGENTTIQMNVASMANTPAGGYANVSVDLDGGLLPTYTIGVCGSYGASSAGKYLDTGGAIATIGYHYAYPIEQSIDVTGVGGEFIECHLKAFIEC